MNSIAHKAKTFLRPAAHAIRQLTRKDVFEVRHWKLPSNVGALTDANADALELDFLWYSGPDHMSRVVIDADFPAHQHYPLPQSELLPLIDVYTSVGQRYLSLVQCATTGVVFHQLLPPRDWQHKYYAETWDAAGQSRSLSPDEFMKTRANKVEKILTRASIKPGARILDVGCGYGDQLFYLKSKGYQVFGLEPSRHRASFASRLLGVPILNSPVEGDEVFRNLSQVGEKFDVIYLNHVFEHLYDPLSVAKLLRQFLTDDGVLLIGVPDYFSECTALFANIILHTHSFTKVGLTNLLGLAGLSLKQDLSFPGYLYCLFEKSSVANVPFAHPATAEVVRYLFKQFDLSSSQLRRGHVISISSSIADSETGYRVKRSPDLQRVRQALNAARSTEASALRPHLPIKVVMPHHLPCVWQK